MKKYEKESFRGGIIEIQTCIKNVREQFKYRKINLVFGCGGERDKPKRKIMGRIAHKYCNKIYLTDDNPRSEDPKKLDGILSQISQRLN